jgi:FKBP-type peptidyl-prolyl cis-trans isomerase
VELFSWRGADLTDQSDGGILKSIITKGKGEKKPLDGDTVEVGLEGKFDGRVFDARTANFVVGEGDENGVFESLETGIKHMNLHEKAVITFQPKYAFGDLGNEQFKIPPNAEVTYQVELTQLDRGGYP